MAVTNNQIIGSLITYSIGKLKVLPEGVNGPYADRQIMTEALETYNPQWVNFLPKFRSSPDALRLTLRELENIPLTITNGDTKRGYFIVKPVGGSYNIDIQIIDTEGKETAYIKFCIITLDKEHNYEVNIEYKDLSQVDFPDVVWNYFNQIPEKINWYRQVLIDDDLRKIIQNFFKTIRTISLRSGILFILPERESLVRDLDSIFASTVENNQSVFSIYHIPGDETSRQSLNNDMIREFNGTLQKIADKIIERDNLLNQARAQVDIENQILYNNRAMDANRMLRAYVDELFTEATEFQNLLPEIVPIVSELSNQEANLSLPKTLSVRNGVLIYE